MTTGTSASPAETTEASHAGDSTGPSTLCATSDTRAEVLAREMAENWRQGIRLTAEAYFERHRELAEHVAEFSLGGMERLAAATRRVRRTA